MVCDYIKDVLLLIATIINAALVIAGGLIGVLFGNRIKERYTKAIMTVMSLVTVVIGIKFAVGTSDILIIVVCLVLGTLMGTALKLDDRLNNSGDFIKEKLKNTKLGKGSFSDAFVTTSVLFCVGSMTVIGSIQAGLNHDYSILLTKSVMDFIASIAFASAFGGGVILSAVTVLLVQGSITLLASVISPLLTAEVIAEMSAVGGAMFIGMAINMLGLREEKIKVGDMLPGIILPIAYIPIANWITSII